MEELRDAIRYHNYRYYVWMRGHFGPEYDQLMAGCRIGERFPDLQTPTRPNALVGGQPRRLGCRAFQPHAHLQAVYTGCGTRFRKTCRQEWAFRLPNCGGTNTTGGRRAGYQGGRLSVASTRGDGQTSRT